MKSLGPKQKLILYGLTIFLSSAFLLVLEITAGRLLAPYIGVSLYTWTSIIGVILAGLSLGNWIGGRWADAGGNEKAAGFTLVLGAIFSFLILVILQSLAPVIQKSELNLLTSSFVYVLLLFFMPSLLLGVITPLLTTMALSLDSRTGHIVGRMHALATLGSIVGTFVTGYWLVQYVGTRNIIVGTAVALLILSVPFLLDMQRKLAVFLLSIGFVSGGMIFLSGANISPCDRESNYYCIRIVDKSASVPYGQARAMILDHLMHGINHKTEDWLLVTSYTHLMDELILRHFGQKVHNGLRYFFAGGGSYSQPRATRALYKDAHITVAEIDAAVTEMAEQQMYYKRRGAIIKHRDARLVLFDAVPDSFDVVVGDVFHDISIPYHLLTLEYVQLLKSRLSVNGLYILNIIDAWPDAQLAKSVLKTLGSEFRHVDIWADRIPIGPVRMTYVISATDKAVMPDKISSKRGFQRTWYRITNRIIPNEKALANVPLLTDDYVPVERLIAPLLFSKMGR
ncbi:MAG: fused MFS/spermidine synthase [Acidiferrobacterales bacterium]